MSLKFCSFRDFLLPLHQKQEENDYEDFKNRKQALVRYADR